MAATVTPPWAVDSSKAPEPARSMKHVQAAAALSTAQSILYPSPEDAAQGARTGKKVLHNGAQAQCPFATDNLNAAAKQHKRPQLQVDKFSIGSDKVGSQPLDNDVYKQNLTESRERMANAKAVNYKGAGDVANRA